MPEFNHPYCDKAELSKMIESLMKEILEDGVKLSFEVVADGCSGGLRKKGEYLLKVEYETYRYLSCDEHIGDPNRRGICKQCRGWFQEIAERQPQKD